MKWWLNSAIAPGIDAEVSHPLEKPVGFRTLGGGTMAVRLLTLLLILTLLLAGVGCANDHQVVEEHRKALSQEEEG